MSRKTNSNPLWAESGPVRLQRILAAAGFGSRRSVEKLILEGRVEVDGEVVDQLGSSADPSLQDVRVDGESLRAAKPLYFAVNKPTGVVTTNRDPQGRPRVVDLAPPQHRVFPVGRLDQHSEGLILLTNDGWLSQRLAHPRFGVEKIYQVIIAGEVPPDLPKRMERGIHIAEGVVRAKHVRVRSARPRSSELEVVLDEGKNREIRRMLARLGHKVMRLRRIAFGPLRLGDLPLGACRPLNGDEIEKLREAALGKGFKQRPEGVRRKDQSEPSDDVVDASDDRPAKPTKHSSAGPKPPRAPIVGGSRGKPFSSRAKPVGKVTIIGGDRDEPSEPSRPKFGKPAAKSGTAARVAVVVDLLHLAALHLAQGHHAPRGLVHRAHALSVLVLVENGEPKGARGPREGKGEVLFVARSVDAKGANHLEVENPGVAAEVLHGD